MTRSKRILSRRPLLIPIALLSLWLLLSATLLPHYAITVGPNPVTESPADMGLDFTEVTIPSSGIDLEGWWIPAEAEQGVILFVHGAGSNRTSWFIQSLDLYKAFVEQGFSVLTADLRNHGNSPRTDGRLGMGATEWQDVIAMANWLEQTPAGALPRFALGASMGGAAVIHALNAGLAVNGAILFDPALNTRDALAQGGWIQTGIPAPLLYPYAWATTAFWGLPGPEQDALAVGLSLTAPVLIVQDPEDPITRLSYAQVLSVANPHMQLAVAPATPPDDRCIAGKGRWGSHVAAFSCHPDWFMTTVNAYLQNHRAPF